MGFQASAELCKIHTTRRAQARKKTGGRWAAARRRAAAALGGGAPPPNGPRGRRPLAGGPAGRSAAARLATLAAFLSLLPLALAVHVTPRSITIFRSGALRTSVLFRLAIVNHDDTHQNATF